MKFNKRKSKKDLQYPQILQLDDDFALIQRFIEGDESTFRILVQRHKDKIRNIIYLVLNSSDMVDDIAQDVLITTYKNLKSFRFESQFSTWLYRITVNKCKDHLRKIKIRSIFAPIKDGEEDPKYVPSTEGKDISEFVHKAISRLPEKLRVPLLLKDIEGFSYQEIAESIDCEIGTVKSRIFRARESLREFLEPFKKELME
jgi:RNA polymerase sigma-70 factor, ECF subfamily